MSRWTKKQLRDRAAHLRRSVVIGEHQGGLDDYGAMQNDAEICEQAASDAETLENVKAWAAKWAHKGEGDPPPGCDPWTYAAHEVLALLGPPLDAGTGQTPTCETCRFNGGTYKAALVEGRQYGRYCEMGSTHYVPLTVNGQPFHCAGWQPSVDPSSGTRGE